MNIIEFRKYFEELSPEETEKLFEVYKTLSTPLLRGLIRDGIVDIDRISNIDLKDKLIDVFIEIISDQADLMTVIDHRQDLLNWAARARDEGSHHIACILYSIWAEHWINNLISATILRQGGDDHDVQEELDEFKLKEKFSRFIKSHLLEPISLSHIKKITELIKLRNSYFHFNWIATETIYEYKDPFEKISTEFEDTVQYLKNYEVEFLYGGSEDPFSDL